MNRTLTPAPLPQGEGRSGANNPFSLGEKVARDSGPDELSFVCTHLDG